MIGREDEVREYRDRVRWFQLIMVCMLIIILSRAFYLQVLKGDELRRFSEANRLRRERLHSTRGIIFDRNGKVIVDNRAAFDVVLLSQYYPFTKEMNERLSKALGIPLPELEKKLEKAKKGPSFAPYLLRADVPKDVLASIEMEMYRDERGFPGVDIEATVQRRYPYGDIAAQLLGYIGEVDPKDIKGDASKQFQPGDYIGKMGIERNYDSFLRGVNGVGYVEVDAYGRRKKAEAAERLLGFVAQTEPVAGNNIYLTLDADLETAAAEALRSRKFQGSIVALDPRSGEVLALVNSPSYDPGLISGREINNKVWQELRTSKDRPLRNRAIQDHYPPGSTFKLFVAIAGLAEGTISPKQTIQCNGGMQFGNRRFACWKRHGTVDFSRAIKESCDVYFYNLGHQLEIDNIAKYARAFGLGAATGIKISGESRGLIPDTEWKKKVYKDIWHPGETLSVSIGQGYVDVTPIQLVTGYAAIANGGFVYRPYLIRRIEGRGGEIIREFQPELTRKIEVPTEVFEAAKEGLYRVVNEPGGTAFLSKSKITTISGKTGTAQVRAFADIMKVRHCEELPYYDRHHGWFVGYAPRDNPQIAVVAIAEHGCHGSAAGPMVREVIDSYIRKQALLAGTPLPEEKPIRVAKKIVDDAGEDQHITEEAVKAAEAAKAAARLKAAKKPKPPVEPEGETPDESEEEASE